jgi:hypothetical protein
MKRFSALLLMMLWFGGDALATHEGWKLFRKSDPPFRFEYPSAWVEKTPRGENVKALVSSNDPGTGANCNVLIRAAPELEGVTPAQAITELVGPGGVAAVLSEAQPGSRVLWSRMSALDGRPAVLSLRSLQYSTVKGTFEIRELALWSLIDGKAYQMLCGAVASRFSEVEPTFMEIFSTLVLESWKR